MSLKSDMSDLTDIILSGKLSEIPPLPKRTLKIYLCSNRSDFELERYHLWRDALPALQQECVQHGLDVVWMDVHYGSEIDHVQDAYRFQEHLEEIKKCHQQSVGPFFVCLIGNKYGDCPLPIHLDEQEFQDIRKGILSCGKDTTLLDEWYSKDGNSVPSVYTLRPIREKYQNYEFRPKMNLKDHQTAVENWTTTYKDLLNLIQQGAKQTFNKVVNLDKKEKFDNSGLETEITEALSLSPKDCVFLERNIECINTGVVGATSFVDLAADIAIDSNKQKLLDRLKDRIRKNVITENIFKFDIAWLECENVHKAIEQHGEYMENIIAGVTTRLISIVKKCVNKQNDIEDEIQPVSSDILVHLHHCKNMMTDLSLSGFEKLLSIVHNLILTGRKVEHNPILITGSSGCGKSTLISTICHQIRNLLGEDIILIVRCLGLSPQSVDGKQLLQGICMQINHVLHQNIDLKSYDLKHLNSYFNGLKNRIANSSNNFVIVIDDVDHLEGINGIKPLEESGEFDWLSTKLPAKVHLIMSSQKIENENGVLKRLASKCATTGSCVMFPQWTLQQYSLVLNKKLNDIHRTVTEEQEAILLQMFSNASTCPVLINTIVEIAANWKDDTQPNLHLPSTITEALHHKMDNLEMMFGLKVIQQIVCYFLISDFGISEMEIMDCLSSNMEIIQTLDLASQLICRIPISLWISIRNQMEILLTKILIHRKQLFVWKNKAIKDILNRRYLLLSSDRAKYHLDLAYLFLEMSQDPEKDLFGSELCLVDPCRIVTCPQPLLYSNVRYNMRSINEVWMQLLNSGDISLLKEYVFCNFEYLLALTHSSSVDFLLEILQITMKQVLDAEISIVHQAVSTSRKILLKYPNQLANELISRLRKLKDLYTHHLDSLVTQCMRWCDSNTVPLMVPLTSWLHLQRIQLAASVDGLDGIKNFTVLPNNQSILCSLGLVNIVLYHIPTKRILRTFSGHKGPVNCIELTYNGQCFITGSDDKCIRIWNLSEGLCTHIIKEHHGPVTCLTLSQNDDHVMSGSYDGNVLICEVSSGKKIHVLQGHKKAVTCLKLIDASKLLLSGSKDRTIIMWCMVDMIQLNTFRDYINNPILSIDVSSDSIFLLVACEDSTLNVISFATGSWIHQLKGHNGWINKVLVCEDCNHVIAVCQDGSVYVYNLRNTELLETFRGTYKPITDVRVSSDETLIYSCSDNMLKVWSLHKKYTNNSNDMKHSSTVTCVHAWDGTAATGSENGVIKVWNMEQVVLRDSYYKHTSSITCLQVSYDSSFIVSGSRDKTICVYDMRMQTVITFYQEHKAPIQALCIFTDDSQVISIDCNSIVYIWKPHTAQTLRSYTNINARLFLLSSHGSHLVTTGGDQSVKVVALEDESIVAYINHAEHVTCLACSVDDKYMVTGSADKTLKIWEMFNGKLIQVLVEHTVIVCTVAIGDDNEHVVSGCKNGQLTAWCVHTGVVKYQLIGHTNGITVVKLTNKGKLIISASMDSTIRLWSLQYGQQITMIDMHCPVINFSMSEDASRMVVQLEKNKYSPLLCLHNSPSVEGNPPWDPEITKVLPINVKTRQHRLALEYPVQRLPARKRIDSVSSVPEIVKVSPMRAPQSKKKGRRKPGKSKHYQLLTRKAVDNSNHKLSSVCSIL
ncbi:protein qui-1-like [Mytilus galloprovincialis]|uniref:protein qui-1-like n=1 Tax=Mytilus galloprovincialis TaxID=29158 RepID=UPI003F7B54FB